MNKFTYSYVDSLKENAAVSDTLLCLCLTLRQKVLRAPESGVPLTDNACGLKLRDRPSPTSHSISIVDKQKFTSKGFQRIKLLNCY